VTNETLNTKTLTGTDPNEKFLNWGFYAGIAGVISLLGINVGGVEVGTPHAQYAPWGIILLAGFSMWYGKELKKTSRIAEQAHELAMADKRKNERPKHELTKGDEEFLEFIKPYLPVTVAQLRELKFAYDQKRTKTDLCIASIYRRMESVVREGTIRKYGDQFDLRDKPDGTILQ